MGLSIADAASLVTKGYKVSELKEVGKLIDQNPSEGNNIIELAKKLGYSEFQSAMQLFVKPEEKPEDHKDQDDETDQKGADDQTVEKCKDSSADDQGGVDDVDYKKLYEDEKKLRESLQNSEARKPVEDAEEKLSDYDRALQIVADVLN